MYVRHLFSCDADVASNYKYQYHSSWQKKSTKQDVGKTIICPIKENTSQYAWKYLIGDEIVSARVKNVLDSQRYAKLFSRCAKQSIVSRQAQPLYQKHLFWQFIKTVMMIYGVPGTALMIDLTHLMKILVQMCL